ncbi:hypothetical protein ZIOFF_054965 [Zingiber officinale]|uniref:Protein SMG7 n=1 Tax=Zingiber officinale TaxID=94328 RepID=A0A8J5KRI1_ZINOF|nr:hypothetical protein ZIOFF_054965 [Zingiber officinale]
MATPPRCSSAFPPFALSLSLLFPRLHGRGQNIDLENGLRRSAQSKVPSDPNSWFQMRENYETIILEDHDFSEKHDIEYVLWQLHYKRIEEFRHHINAASSAGSNTSGAKALVRLDKVKKIRSVFKSFLMEATGFYHDLILKIRAKYGLPLSYFNEGTDSENILTKDEKKLAEMKKGLMSCYHCLIYLGDLARYKGLYGEGDSVRRDFAAATSYYMQATSMCPSHGNPHHQLAILASYSGDELLAIYRYFRSLAVDIPFSTAKDNLIVAFEKNRQSFSQLSCNSKTTSTGRIHMLSAGQARGGGNEKLLEEDNKVESIHKEREMTKSEVLNAFSTRFVRLNGILFTRTSLEIFEEVFSSLINDLNVLLSLGPEENLNFGLDAIENASACLRLIAILIFTIHNVKRESENQSYAEVLQRTVLLQNAFIFIFEFAGHIFKRCIDLHDGASSFLLPSILVFIEWLACHPDEAAASDIGEKFAVTRLFFWSQCVALLNKLIQTGLVSVDGDSDEACFFSMNRYESETDNRVALWEDFELRGFSPMKPAHTILDFSRKHTYGSDGGKDKLSRVQRIIAAGRALAGVVSVNQQRIYIDPSLKKFIMSKAPPMIGGLMDSTLSSSFDPIERILDIGRVPNTSSSGFSQTKTRPCVEGEEEEEEIVFRPTISDKYEDVNASKLTTFDIFNPLQASSAGDWMAHSHPLSVPFDDVPISAVSNASLNLHPYANTITQLPLQHINSTSRWFPKQDEFLSDGLRNMNISGHLYMNNQMLQEGSNNFQRNSFLPGVCSSAIPNANSAHSGQYKTSEVLFSTPLDTLVHSGAASDGSVLRPSLPLPSLRKTPVSRPVRHLGPPPGFGHIPSKQQEEAIPNSYVKEQQPELDDYGWLDGHQSSSSKSIGMVNSLNQHPHGYPYANMSTTTAFANASSFPFPGKQVSSIQAQATDGHDLQDFEQLKARTRHKLEQSTPQNTLVPEQRQA